MHLRVTLSGQVLLQKRAYRISRHITLLASYFLPLPEQQQQWDRSDPKLPAPVREIVRTYLHHTTV
ncbi:hypothetical protein NBRC116585_14780 [Thalassolituus maritimus]|uniref:Uncharacterized protein n=1 Tax=Thalassolituus maritimus TaxID=484498 RepID=A0ABP9ZYY8_9GAMM